MEVRAGGPHRKTRGDRRYRKVRIAGAVELRGAGGGTRTPTGSEPHGILNPARLPLSPLRLQLKLSAAIYANDLLKERNYNMAILCICSAYLLHNLSIFVA